MKDTAKIIQSLAYIAWKIDKNGMNDMKAYKLLWLADRYQLRTAGISVSGDTYYAMPHGLVPSDAKCILEGENTKLNNDYDYQKKYIKTIDKHHYAVIAEPDTDQFSESDIAALDKVIATFGNFSAKDLSELSHKFPEWTYYQGMLADKDSKNSYRVNIDHFFEPCDEKCNGLFEQSAEHLALTKELYHQYNRI
ncbi:MAG: SocA family protein [Bacteroidales bacterium]|nr:SocA family protein [Bacteroidales bacterium]